MLFPGKSIDVLWLALLGVTLGTAWVAESSEPGLLATAAVAAAIAFKGRVVVDRFMEMHDANRYLRGLMNAYFYVFPLLIVLAELFPNVIKEWTTL